MSLRDEGKMDESCVNITSRVFTLYAFGSLNAKKIKLSLC
jgi:hypothetical protein